MSQASRATTAAQRANIAATYIRRGHTDRRAFSDCFEMGDGGQVAALLLQRAEKCPKIRAYAERALWAAMPSVQEALRGMR